MKKNIILAWTLLAILTVGLAAPVGAMAEDGIMPLYDYVGAIGAGLSISGSTAYCSGDVFLNRIPSSLSMTLTLQKKNGDSWDSFASWSDSVIGGTDLEMSESCTVSSGTYRVKVSISVCLTNGDYEYISEYSPESTK
ncbi:MAG: hypothetical protein E7335_00870 [Clostridiales bacterium]|nr:hypothetical protein [Clostridiales bacterium]